MFALRNIPVKFQKINRNSLRCIATRKRDYKEISIKVPWGYIRGKWWEPYDIRPILTHHGWQDNCGSFNRLIPMLNKDVGFLTVDFPGHGYSSRIGLGSYYSMIYTITIRFIKDYFEWPKVSLMGHSLGGITSYIFTMLYPEEVDFVLCIDGAKPMIRMNKNVLAANALKQFLKENQYASSPNEPPSYTLEEITKKICAPNKNSVLPEVAHHLIERKIAPSKLHPGKYYFTTDPRVKVGDPFLNFSQDELIEYAQYITAPIFIAKAKGGSYYEVKENFYEVLDVLKRTSTDCYFNYVEGTHHVHLNNPENVAELMVNFIRRHNIEDRSIGGIRKEIILDNPELSQVYLKS